MRAMVMYEPGAPEQLVLQEVERPAPGPGEVLVKVVSCGVDYHDVVIRNGVRRMRVTYDDLVVLENGRREVRRGHILGHEVAGVVEEVGAYVTSLRPGDRVACKQIDSCGRCKLCRSGNETRCPNGRGSNHGGMAEYVVLTEESLVPVPEDVDLKLAGFFSCAIGTALHAVKTVGKVQLGETVLVTGASGGVGVHALQLARASGARVIAVTSSPSKETVLAELGADEVVVSPELQFHDRVLELTGGNGVDVVVDTVGSRTFPSAFRSIATLGRYLFVGQLFRENIEVNPAWIFRKSLSMYGPGSTTRQELVESIELVRRGKIRPVCAGMYPLEEAPAVHRLLEERQITGRPVLVM